MIVLSLPAFVKISLAFISILALYRLRISLGLSILINSVALIFLSGAGTGGCKFVLKTMLLPKNYLLLVAILLLIYFTEALRTTGKMEKTVNALKVWMRSKYLLLSGLPALVGLLPMPGGALFSAPLVDSVDQEKQLTPAHKSMINYWFRHIWEYWWPLYPGVILAIRYTSLPIGLFFLIQMPFTIAAVTGGYFFILRRVKRSQGDLPNGYLDIKAVLSTLGPIFILVGLSITGSVVLPLAGIPEELTNLIGMLIGLVIALIMTFSTNGDAFVHSIQIFWKQSTWSLMLIVFGVLVFSSVLQVPLDKTGTTLVAVMHDEFIRMGIPLLLVIMLIPFISGAVTGFAAGFVGASFPLVFALLGNHPPLNHLIATTTLAYSFGYLGMMLSPIHICFVVTNEYFKARLLNCYMYLWFPVAIVLCAALLLSVSYYYLIR